MKHRSYNNNNSMKVMPKFDASLSVRTLVMLVLMLMQYAGSASAERDFNFNDSQVPLLEPKDEPLHTHLNQERDPYVAEASRCHYADSEIMLSLVLKKHDWHDLSDNKKAKVLEKLSKFFAIPKEFIVMESVTKRDLNEMLKESIRKGNNKCHNSSRHLGRVNLMLGCGSTYFSMGEPIANQIGAQMKDGSIDNISGEKFGWWIIWRKHYKTRAQRNRRQIEGSGEVDDYDYEYDDDDEEDTAGVPTEIPAVTTHAHRHHHGQLDPSGENKLDSSSSQEQLERVVDSALPKSNNIDEEIVESVSQLESVITKTIENTKNIKELPVIVDEEVEEDEVVEESAAGTGARVPIEIAGRELEASQSELERKTLEDTNLNLNMNSNDNVVEPAMATTMSYATITSSNAAAASGNHKSASTFSNFEVDADGAVGAVAVDNADADSAVGATALDTSVPLKQHHHNENAIDVNSFGADINVAEVIESSTVIPSSSSAAAAASSSAVVGLENLSSTTSTASTSVVTTTTTTTTIPPSTTLPPISTLSAQQLLITSTTTAAAANTPPQSAYTPIDASAAVSVSSSFFANNSQHQQQQQQQELPSPPSSSLNSSTSSSSSMSSSSSASSSSVSSTNSVTSATTASISSTLQTKDEDESTTLLSVDSQDLDANRAMFNTSQTTYESSPSSPTSAGTGSATTPSTSPTSSGLDATTPTAAILDMLEPKIENTPPMIRSRLQKFAITSGKAFTFTVPTDTFYDNEDLTNLRLQLTDKDGHELKSTSWLQFNADTRELYGLPVDDTVSKWLYLLSATDSGNESVTETVEMNVQQHRLVRTVNHEVNIAVKINEKNMHNIDWQMKLMRAIAATLNDDSTSAIVVREIRQTPQDPNTATFIYYNETLPTSECPENELNNLVKRLDASRLSDLVHPTLGIKTITGQLIGPCLKTHVIKPTTHTTKNLPPLPRNQVDRVNATVGHLLVFKVPSDTFYDPNDNELTLSLKTKEHKELSPRHWLQFDSKNQEFYGTPKSGDIGSEEYLLVAEDSGGLSATDALVVVVGHAPKKDFSVYFKAYLAIRQENFNADLQRKFVERVAKLFGDSGPQFVQIRSVTTHHDSDSTIVNFYNTTLFKQHNRCPEEEIEAARNVYLMQDYLVRDRVKKMLGPELNLTNVQVVQQASCHPQTDVTHREFIPTKTDEPLLKSTFSDEYMYTFILPAVIIVSMIIIASIVACCLHRRRRKSGKMELGDEEERKSFRAKGIPVIFQDELDEKPETGNKSPVILKDEKPPLLPPSYNTSNMNGDNDVDEYLPPPAVVVGGREARGKSPATPSYRKPPPYVSP